MTIYIIFFYLKVYTPWPCCTKLLDCLQLWGEGCQHEPHTWYLLEGIPPLAQHNGTSALDVTRGTCWRWLLHQKWCVGIRCVYVGGVHAGRSAIQWPTGQWCHHRSHEWWSSSTSIGTVSRRFARNNESLLERFPKWTTIFQWCCHKHWWDDCW